MESAEALTVVVIPDSHAQPGVSNERFTLLGRMICSVLGSATSKALGVNIGDMFDLPSLNSFDKPGSKSFEGRRYADDIASGLDAQRLLYKEIEDYNRPRRGDARLDIEWHYTLGNHEARITRAIESDPTKLEGVMSLDELTEDQPIPWTVHPFLKPVFLGGVGFCHYWVSGVMGRGVSGESPAATLLRKQMTSCVQGHSHVLDFSERTTANSKKLSALVCGYYGPYEHWAGPQVNSLWTHGISVLHVQDGSFDWEWWSLRRIQNAFG